MKRNILAVAAMSAALSFGANAYGQAAQGDVKLGPAEGKAKVELPGSDHSDRTVQDSSVNTTTTAVVTHGGVTRFNKASKLIGTEVENLQGQNLGEIQDIVVDMQSGKMSYAVLSVGGFLGVGEKYIAVPTSAFGFSPEKGKLTLNADKEKVKAAQGFVKSQWPDPENPAWGAAADWSVRGGATGVRGDAGAQGVHSEIRTGQGASSSAEINTSAGAHVNTPAAGANLDTSIQTPSSRAASTDIRPSVSVDVPANQATFTGKVTGLNQESRTMIVQGTSGTMTFILDRGATVNLKAGRNSVTDIRPGDTVTVRYQKQPNGLGLATDVSAK